MSLGSASFDFLVNNQQAIVAGAQTEAALKKNYAAVAQAANVSAAQIERSAQQIAQAQSAQAAGFSTFAKSAAGTVVAITGVTVGLAALKQGLDASVTATLKAEQAQRTLTAAYRDSAPQFKAFADAQAQAFGRTNSEVEEGVARLSVLQKQYGITSNEIQNLTRVALNLGATFGDSAEAIRSVQAAIRGEPEALEKYGIALQENAIKNSRLLTEEERKNFTSLDAVSQARIRYRIILAEAAQFENAATERSQSAQGSFDRLARATDEAAKAVGERLVPALAAGADGLASYIEHSKTVAQRNSDLAASFEDFARRYTSALGPLSAIGLFDLITGRGKAPPAAAAPTAGFGRDTGTTYGPSIGDVKAITDQLIAEEERRKKAIADLRKETREAEAKAGERAAEAEHDREVKALDDRKILLEVEKDQKLKAVEETTKAALAGIEAEARAADAASDATIARLHVEQETAERTASDRHDDVVAGLEAEQRAVEDVATETVRQLEIARDAAKQASEDRRDAAIDALDAEKVARDAARVEEDRAAEDSARQATRRESDRHEAAVRGFDAETQAANESKDQQLRNLDELGKKQQDKHEDRLQHLSDEADAERDRHDAAARFLDDEEDREQHRHDAAVRVIEDQGKAASDEHEKVLRRLSDEAEAARDDHDRLTRAGEDEQRAAQDVHEQRLAEIEAEGETAQRQHDQALRGIEIEGRAAEDRHDRLVRKIADEGDAAERVHDDALRGIEERGRAEDDHHRQVLDGLDEEQRRRQDAISEQLSALDKLDRAEQDAATAAGLAGDVEGAKRGVQKAESTGNLSEIEAAQRELARAQQAILNQQTKSQRDATREQLKTQQDAIRDEIAGRKEAENERNRILRDELDAEKRAADDRLGLVKDGLDARKRAADDELALIKDGLDARKRAADDTLALIRDELQQRKDAADAVYKLVVDDIAARKRAADDALATILDRLAREKTAEDDAYQQGVDRRAAARLALDDEYKQGQGRRAAAKRDLDDQLRQSLDRIDAEKRSEDEAFDKTKDRLAKRKLAVADANKDELDKIAARKLAENDAHDNAVTKAQDQATQEKRAVQDRRTAEELADKAKRKEIQDAFENESRDRHARYDDEATGEIPALRRALSAAQDTFRQRKEAADFAYQSEQRQIQDLYTNAETGLIPLAQRAAAEVAQKFRDQATAVTASAQAQKAAINDQYTNASKTGLLDLLERARADSQDKLDRQRQYWKDWAEDLGGPQGQIQKVIGKFDDLINKIKEAGGTVMVGGGPQPPAGTPTYNPPPGAGSAGGVPSPYRTTFPFDAPYNGPFAGGAAWQGGPPRHRGIDLALPGPDNGHGSQVGAFQPGRVLTLTDESAGGKGVIIQTPSGLYNYYGHLDRQLVGDGDTVAVGQPIGTLGRTGLDGGMQTHLHYEVRKGPNGDPVGQTINPVPFMTGGTAGAPGGQTFEFDLFGRHFSVTLPFRGGGSAAGGFREMVERVRAAVEAYGIPPEVPAAIAGNESGYAHPSQLATQYHNWFGVKGSGDAGQTPPLSTWEDLNGNGREDPGERIMDQFAAYSSDGAAFSDWARQFSTGRYAAAKAAYQQSHRPIDYLQGLYTAGYATDAAWVGKVRAIGGFANGGLIPEPTLLVGRTRGPYAIAGETGTPEWVTPHAPGTSGGGSGRYDRIEVDVMLGPDRLKRLTFEGISLNVRAGDIVEVRR